MDWVLKHHNDLKIPALLAVTPLSYRQQIDGPWILEEDGDNNEELLEENFGWNSDDDSVPTTKDGDEAYVGSIFILGFHPFKEVVFFAAAFGGAFYHLNSSKVQCLGQLRPKDYYLTLCAGICEAFPYTPCMLGEFPDNNS